MASVGLRRARHTVYLSEQRLSPLSPSLPVTAMSTLSIDNDLYTTTDKAYTDYGSPSSNVKSHAGDSAFRVRKSQRRTPKTSNTRTRTGCVTCKSRRVKCNEIKPSCGACTRRGDECSYEKVVAKPPLTWVTPLSACTSIPPQSSSSIAPQEVAAVRNGQEISQDRPTDSGPPPPDYSTPLQMGYRNGRVENARGSDTVQSQSQSQQESLFSSVPLSFVLPATSRTSNLAPYTAPNGTMPPGPAPDQFCSDYSMLEAPSIPQMAMNNVPIDWPTFDDSNLQINQLPVIPDAFDLQEIVYNESSVWDPSQERACQGVLFPGGTLRGGAYQGRSL